MAPVLGLGPAEAPAFALALLASSKRRHVRPRRAPARHRGAGAEPGPLQFLDRFAVDRPPDRFRKRRNGRGGGGIGATRARTAVAAAGGRVRGAPRAVQERPPSLTVAATIAAGHGFVQDSAWAKHLRVSDPDLCKIDILARGARRGGTRGARVEARRGRPDAGGFLAAGAVDDVVQPDDRGDLSRVLLSLDWKRASRLVAVKCPATAARLPDRQVRGS
jgi:hypothetical protein